MEIRTIWCLQLLFRIAYSYREVYHYAPAIEWEHDPERYTTSLSPFLFGTIERVPFYYETPDYRVEEPLYLPHRLNYYYEENRPYRMSPHYKAVSRWHGGENINYAGCYCTTVYKRLTLLAGCAVLTTRHLLTTATSTHLIMKNRYDNPHLEGVLGAWYDTNHNNYNSSMYLTPAQIHYHPLWHYPEDVNRSHPFSFTFDLSVWATTHNVYGWYLNAASTYTCLRATAHSRDTTPPTPTNELYVLVGFQFMYAYRRKPMPWFKYGIRSTQHLHPCPKTEWGWFTCAYGNYFKYGIDSGMALHRTFRGSSWKYDGLIGLGAFTMGLRYTSLVHYFTILDTYPVLDFLYDAYRVYNKPVFKDLRFHHPYRQAPVPTGKYFVPIYHIVGDQWGFHPYYD